MHADDLTDKKRNASVSFAVGDANDITPIGDMFTTNEGLYLITNMAIYLVRLADEIDPERTNPNLPNVHKKVLNHGLDHEVVGRVLLTAKTLFDKNHLGPNFNCHAALSNAFELTKLLTEMQDIRAHLATNIDAIIKQGLKTGVDGSLRLPIVSKLATHIETIIKKADQVRDIIFAYLKLVYNSGTNKNTIENLYSDIVTKHGAQSGLAQFVDSMMLPLKFIRNVRNAIEHPKEDNRVLIVDFDLATNGTVDPPSIELINKETPQPKILVTFFMEQLVGHLIDIVEYLMAHLCASNMQRFGGFECGIMELSPERRRHKNTRFSYAVRLQGQWQPLG